MGTPHSAHPPSPAPQPVDASAATPDRGTHAESKGDHRRCVACAAVLGTSWLQCGCGATGHVGCLARAFLAESDHASGLPEQVRVAKGSSRCNRVGWMDSEIHGLCCHGALSETAVLHVTMRILCIYTISPRAFLPQPPRAAAPLAAWCVRGGSGCCCHGRRGGVRGARGGGGAGKVLGRRRARGKGRVLRAGVRRRGVGMQMAERVRGLGRE